MRSTHPVLIQGGMGVGVSGWRLAQAVSKTGQLGVVSGTALDTVIVRRLQIGDPGGHVRRALDQYPDRGAARQIVDRFFIEGGKSEGQRFKRTSMKREKPSRFLEHLLVASNFVEVHLAKEGHDGLVGINYLEKLQAPTLPSLYGAMLAGVDYVLMGAGIPRAIPAILNRLADGLPVELKLNVDGAAADDHFVAHFDPKDVLPDGGPPLVRPTFLAIVSSHLLATMLARKASIPVDGFIVEGHSAGGHNAPPRGKLKLDDRGEPIYGDRDTPDLSAIRDLGLPFWLAGGWSEPEKVREALRLGANGVQVGTPFAYCSESDLEIEAKRQVLAKSLRGDAQVYTDPLASPSGFPFKIVELEGTMSDAEVYGSRTRAPCELGYLRSPYRTNEGNIGWRCPAEPIEQFVGKGGPAAETNGSMCLCNGLLANIGLEQPQRDGYREPMLLTSGDEVAEVSRFLAPGSDTYDAANVVRYLLPTG